LEHESESEKQFQLQQMSSSGFGGIHHVYRACQSFPATSPGCIVCTVNEGMPEFDELGGMAPELIDELDLPGLIKEHCSRYYQFQSAWQFSETLWVIWFSECRVAGK
jgi:hypothetical protein